MPTCEIEFSIPEFNQWPLNREPSAKVFGCEHMEKARGGSWQGAGRPQNEGTTQSKVTVFLGRDEEARESKRKLDEMHHELKPIQVT